MSEHPSNNKKVIWILINPGRYSLSLEFYFSCYLSFGPHWSHSRRIIDFGDHTKHRRDIRLRLDAVRASAAAAAASLRSITVPAGGGIELWPWGRLVEGQGQTAEKRPPPKTLSLRFHRWRHSHQLRPSISKKNYFHYHSTIYYRFTM
ncbi:hypothetical protein TcasGA2_TC013557 [Tribolium castaneum]|uniref:Uncharacterized protein n=1 Tax=Tribolium castaneum TaxID=7070 RepID=D6WKW0_TRICA|nr:hypothetical protein TcasGA2_TC013557 [Tribolium castaneum]